MGRPESQGPRERGGPHNRQRGIPLRHTPHHHPASAGQGNRQKRWQDFKGHGGALRKDSGSTHSHSDWLMGLERHPRRSRDSAHGQLMRDHGSQGAKVPSAYGQCKLRIIPLLNKQFIIISISHFS